MVRRLRQIFSALVIAGCFIFQPVIQNRGLGETLPYPKKACRELADALALTVPIPKPFTTRQEWFRDGELGIKGEQCRISAGGKAKKGKGAKKSPGAVEIASAVARVLAEHGFKKDKQLERYKRQAGDYRAFARRKKRSTCWVNLETESPAQGVAGTKKKEVPVRQKLPKEKLSKPPKVWRLTVDCFTG